MLASVDVFELDTIVGESYSHEPVVALLAGQLSAEFVAALSKLFELVSLLTVPFVAAAAFCVELFSTEVSSDELVVDS